MIKNEATKKKTSSRSQSATSVYRVDSIQVISKVTKSQINFAIRSSTATPPEGNASREKSTSFVENISFAVALTKSYQKLL